MKPSRRAAWAFLALTLPGCVQDNARPRPPVPPQEVIGVELVTRTIPASVAERRAWASAILSALDASGTPATRETVCAVVAVIEQESSFVANPTIPNLAKIIDTKLESLSDHFGPFGSSVRNTLLSGHAPGDRRTFAERLKTVRTERDVDLVFRDLVAFYRARFPKTAATVEIAGAVFGGHQIDDWNPITTAGSMQVSVRFAAERGAQRGMSREQVREALYTRDGGVEYGTARLFAYDAGYDRMLYRFADYNAGAYASRNAALQEQVAKLVGTPLALDGDLLAYDSAGNALPTQTKSLSALLSFRRTFAPDLSESRIRSDVAHEKELALETTPTYLAVKQAYAQRRRVEPSYARLPDVTLHSPKLSRGRTTAWFAQRVDERFRRCVSRLPPVAGR